MKSLEQSYCGPSSELKFSGVIPTILKIDGSIVSFFQNSSYAFFKPHAEDIKSSNKKPPIVSLSIEFAAYHRSLLSVEKLTSNLYQCLSDFLDEFFKSMEQNNRLHAISNYLSTMENQYSTKYMKFVESISGLISSETNNLEPFLSLVSKYASMASLRANCSSSNILSSLKYYDNHAEIHDLHKYDHFCLIYVITYLASKGIVQRLSITETPRFTNFEARGHIQSGYIGKEPYSKAGLTGYGQTVGVTDTGLDDLSSFFIDNSEAYHSFKTDRSGIFQPKRRKVVQYRPLGDDSDEMGGHGTHVVGTIVGSPIISEFSNMRGIAFDAKVAFYDVVVDEMFVTSSMWDMFDASYATGARVHTNSWGGCCNLYGARSFDIDAYLYQHPDFLVIFSGGNEGPAEYTMSVEASSKNALAIGAGQVSFMNLFAADFVICDLHC